MQLGLMASRALGLVNLLQVLLRILDFLLKFSTNVIVFMIFLFHLKYYGKPMYRIPG